MGYFGSPVPNTALAKEAGMAYWAQGWLYLRDFAAAYPLWAAPGGARPAVGARPLRTPGQTKPARRRRAPGSAPAAPAGRPPARPVRRARGGDFMHGRMLLPSLFALLLPRAVGGGPRWWQPPPAGAVLPWAW